MQTLLKLYTSANTIYPLRVKASDEEPRIIDQPCLCLFGTAIPDIFYEALSPKMLSNDFFARPPMLIFEATSRIDCQYIIVGYAATVALLVSLHGPIAPRRVTHLAR